MAEFKSEVSTFDPLSLEDKSLFSGARNVTSLVSNRTPSLVRLCLDSGSEKTSRGRVNLSVFRELPKLPETSVTKGTVTL